MCTALLKGQSSLKTIEAIARTNGAWHMTLEILSKSLTCQL